jgi:hypothetical protein
VKQGGTYYVYASVADPGDPSTGVASVTADVSTLTPGQTAVVLSAGSWTVGGVSYNYRSASMTANNPIPEGPRTFSIRAQDVAGNVLLQPGFSVTVDNTAPSAADVQAANASGGTVGRAETGDTITLTFSEAIEPGSILAGWDGTATTVAFRLVNQGGSDGAEIWDAANATQLPLGSVDLGKNYTNTDVTFSGSTMVMSGSVITVTLGTPDGAVRTVNANGTMTWTPLATPYDVAANVCTATAATETGPADTEF